ncbi:MAG: hypothetical protein V4696_10155 [Pseudomonadota bacterium]
MAAFDADTFDGDAFDTSSLLVLTPSPVPQPVFFVLGGYFDPQYFDPAFFGAGSTAIPRVALIADPLIPQLGLTET